MKNKISILVEPIYLDKDRCIIEARMLVNSKRINMSIMDCAKEIYAHTVVYYCTEKIKKLNIDLKWLSNHANPIDLEDYGDFKHRKIIYNLIWVMIPSK